MCSKSGQNRSDDLWAPMFRGCISEFSAAAKPHGTRLGSALQQARGQRAAPSARLPHSVCVSNTGQLSP